MALTAEDGTGLPDANSYVTPDEADVILTANASWTDLDSDAKEAALIAATEYLDTRFRWYGNTLTENQALLWPRTRNYDNRGRIIPPGTIPRQLKQATAQLAAVNVEDPAALTSAIETTGSLKEFRVEGLAFTFDQNANLTSQFEGNRYPEIETLLLSIGEYRVMASLKNRTTERAE
jgi:hypothetical protein